MHPLIRRTQASERYPETARIALSALAFYASVLTLCRLLPYSRSLTSRSIGEALPNDAFNCSFGALYVIYAKPDAIGIAEIEFCNVTVKVLFRAVLIEAFHAALENRIVAFHCVGRHTANVTLKQAGLSKHF